MSKKKATMTLKDFHGGSIPSDLQLPSAPGVTVRPADRSNHDRQSVWGVGRSNSASSVKAFDDKTPFLATNVHIGRNFDEDERTPIDGSSGPRRTVSDDILHPSVVILEDKPRVSGKPTGSSYVSRAADRGGRVDLNHLSVGGGQTNVWTARKEAAGVTPYGWSEEVAASKLAHASALDKVSSGRWQTKLLVPQPSEVKCLLSENSASPRFPTSYANLGVGIKQEDSVGLIISESGHNRHVQLPSSLQESAPIRKPSFGDIPVNNDTVHVHQPSKQPSRPLSSELSERPRLNLLPRSKPLDKAPLPSAEHEQQTIFPAKPISGGSRIENPAEERPKIIIRPPSPHSHVTTVKERNALFGDARPRELVLQARGVVTDNSERIQSPNRMKNEILKPEAHNVNTPSRQYERDDNQSDKVGRKIEREENKVQNDKVVNPTNRRSDGRKINIEIEKQQKERQPSPETWRKPDTSSAGVRNGKAASAVELALAFSRSTSDPKASERLRTLPNASNRNSVPFSRLTVSDSRPHIHGQ